MTEVDKTGVHQTHCCDKHGCKYGDHKACPVVLGKVKQEYPCETCGTCDQREGGFYTPDLVWHPRITSILRKVAKQLGPKGRGRLSKKTLRQLQFAAGLLGPRPA